MPRSNVTIALASTHRRVLLRLCATLAVACSGCFDGQFTKGEPCAADSDCGPNLSCEEGVCGGKPCGCEQLDMLIILDNTAALQEFVGPLGTGLGLYDDELVTFLRRACSLHVGLATTAPQLANPAECQHPGSLTQVNQFGTACAYSGPGPYLTEVDAAGDMFNSTLVCAGGVVSSEATGDARIADAMLAALDPAVNAVDGCNAGFSRPRAPLILVIASARDDASEISAQEWFDRVAELRGGETEDIYPMALRGPADPGSCSAEPGSRIDAFVEKFDVANRVTQSICAEGAEVQEVFQHFISRVGTVCPESQ